MRSISFYLPLTFLAGQHGFVIFVPYLGVFLIFANFIRGRRNRVMAMPVVAAVPMLVGSGI